MAANRGQGNELDSFGHLSCTQLTSAMQPSQSGENFGVEMCWYMKI
jgi:hypothetical protein